MLQVLWYRMVLFRCSSCSGTSIEHRVGLSMSVCLTFIRNRQPPWPKGIVGAHCCNIVNWTIVGTLLQDWTKVIVGTHWCKNVNWGHCYNGECGSHCNNDLGYHCCICHSLGCPADVSSSNVVWTTALEFQCTPKSASFQFCFCKSC
jgi:hypothetical protein